MTEIMIKAYEYRFDVYADPHKLLIKDEYRKAFVKTMQ